MDETNAAVVTPLNERPRSERRGLGAAIDEVMKACDALSRAIEAVKRAASDTKQSL